MSVALAAAVIGLGVVGAQAQLPGNQRPPAGSESPIDTATATRLVWSTLTAVDQANATGNYSVLRDLGVPSFQANNSAASLASIFQVFRTQNLDLGLVLNAIPTFEFAPAVRNGILRLRGVFPIRPTPFGFDLVFQNVNGRWALAGISVTPLVPVQQRGSTKQ